MNQRQVSDVWERGDPYEQYVGRWSRQVAPLFLNWLGVSPDRRWLDIGCGTGAICAAILDACSPLSVVGVEPSDGFLESARRQLEGRVRFYRGDATAIPLEDSSVDVVVSGLVLNFVPDQAAALAEMARVTSTGGIIAAYVWDYAEKMELMRYFWDAAIQLDPSIAHLDEGLRFPICNPEALVKLFAAAKLEHIEVRAIEIPTPFASFEEYWSPFLGGQGPAPVYAMSLEESARLRLRESLRERIPVLVDGSILMIARVWAIQARVAD
jgi:SAM-dependent methyltransferase